MGVCTASAGRLLSWRTCLPGPVCTLRRGSLLGQVQDLLGGRVGLGPSNMVVLEGWVFRMSGLGCAAACHDPACMAVSVVCGVHAIQGSKRIPILKVHRGSIFAGCRMYMHVHDYICVHV